MDFPPRSPGAKSHNACPPLADTDPRDEHVLSPPSFREATSSSYFRSWPPGSAPAVRDQLANSQTPHETARESAQTDPQSAVPLAPPHCCKPKMRTPHRKSATIALLHQLCRAPLVIESACKPVRRAVSRLGSFSPPAKLKRACELKSSRPNRFSILILARVLPAPFLECGRLVDPELRRAAAFSLVAVPPT